MGIALKKTLSAPLIRRVVRRGRKFVCGICRRDHDFPLDAENCLDSCWQEALKAPAVSRHGQNHFRCRFCGRNYGAEEQANYCAEICKSRINRKHNAENQVARIQPAARVRHNFEALQHVAVKAKLPVKLHRTEDNNDLDTKKEVRAEELAKAIPEVDAAATGAPPEADEEILESPPPPEKEETKAEVESTAKEEEEEEEEGENKNK